MSGGLLKSLLQQHRGRRRGLLLVLGATRPAFGFLRRELFEFLFHGSQFPSMTFTEHSFFFHDPQLLFSFGFVP